jgi:hypothetical protein
MPTVSLSLTGSAVLADRGFVLTRNTSKHLRRGLLRDFDVLVLLQPCDPKWELTTSAHSPCLSNAEIHDIRQFVKNGGGLVIVSEYEHDKYGNNLNELLRPIGIRIENTTVSDERSNLHGTPTWVLVNLQAGEADNGLAQAVTEACFYRAASCGVKDGAGIALPTAASPTLGGDSKKVRQPERRASARSSRAN